MTFVHPLLRSKLTVAKSVMSELGLSVCVTKKPEVQRRNWGRRPAIEAAPKMNVLACNSEDLPRHFRSNHPILSHFNSAVLLQIRQDGIGFRL
jgi:hypothetical protein